ncbi:MAG: hypothetical protein RI958_1460 [Actinomycetota bacterium]
MVRRAVLAPVMTVLVWALVATAGGRVVSADDTAGLDVSASSVFTVDSAASVVRAELRLTFVNSTVDQTVGTSVRRQYFTGYLFPAPIGSTAARAVDSEGRVVPVDDRPVADDDEFDLLSVTFPEPLFSGDRIIIDVTYDITGMPPRSPSPSRVNPAYAAFTAFGVGDPGQASIEVRIPEAFEIDTFGDDELLTISVDGGVATYSIEAIPDPGEFAFFVSARNDSALARDEFDISDDARFVIRSWPDDPVWVEFVTEQIAAGVPLLAELVERPWPIDRRVEIRQAFTPYLYGYAGWFSAAEAELEIGEDLDSDTVLHELAHAWFNAGWFAERWASEGLAQVYGDSALALLGGAPAAAEPPDPSDAAAFALVDWGAPRLEQGADETETFGYGASHWVMQRIVEDVGFAAMADVVDSIEAGALPYVGDATTPSTDGLASGSADWRRLLDLLEERAASDDAGDLIRMHVADSDGIGLLDQRLVARVAYDQLARAGGTWAPPLAVRVPLSDWDFAEAHRQIEAATDIVLQRDELRGLGDSLDLDLTSDLEVAFEAAAEFDDITSTLDRRRAAAVRVGEAVAAVADDRDVLELVGLIGADPVEVVELARRSLADGDTEAATASADRALDIVGDASSVGARRAAVATGLLLVVAAVLAVVLRRRNARTARRASQAAET